MTNEEREKLIFDKTNLICKLMTLDWANEINSLQKNENLSCLDEFALIVNRICFDVIEILSSNLYSLNFDAITNAKSYSKEEKDKFKKLYIEGMNERQTYILKRFEENITKISDS